MKTRLLGGPASLLKIQRVRHILSMPQPRDKWAILPHPPQPSTMEPTPHGIVSSEIWGRNIRSGSPAAAMVASWRLFSVRQWPKGILRSQLHELQRVGEMPVLKRKGHHLLPLSRPWHVLAVSLFLLPSQRHTKDNTTFTLQEDQLLSLIQAPCKPSLHGYSLWGLLLWEWVWCLYKAHGQWHLCADWSCIEC